MSEKTESKNNLRIHAHPVTGRTIENRSVVKICVNSQTLEVFEGESLAAALWANGFISIGHNPDSEMARGMYCGIGHCYECRVNLDGIEDVRSCLVPVREGMQVNLNDPDPVEGKTHGD